MFWRTSALVALLGVGLPVAPATVAAQTSASPPLTLDDCLRLAAAEHPLLKAAGHRIEAARARVEQAKALPQPTIVYDSDLQPRPFHFVDSGESYLGITQSLGFPGHRKTRADIARREQDTAAADADGVRIVLAYNVRRAFFGLLRAEERLRHLEQDRDLVAGFLKTAETRLAAGDTARVEVVRARVEAAQAATEVQGAAAAVRLARAALNVEMGRPQGEPIAVTGDLRVPPLTESLEDLQQRALVTRPEIRRLGHALDAELLRAKQARQDRWPGFELGVSSHRVDGARRTWDVTVALPVPLFYGQAAKGPVAEAQANVLAIRRELEHQRHAIGLEVEAAFVEAQLARDQIRLYEEQILAEAEEAHGMLLFSFEQGEIGGFELIASRRTLVAARLGYADALYNHAVALAAVEMAAGR
ncbi:MAG TPA: TolC family protein [Vicinamibacterales bacterium]|nr:TolC family protein [Vicinamibacterales bacterium]HPW20303.1 TolC family protein [Vicinamibacterales bacterium]